MARLAEWLAKRVGILLVLAVFGVSISLVAALCIWALSAIATPPPWMAEVSASKMVTATWQGAIAIALVIGGVVAAYKFDLFREGKPHLTIDLSVSSRPINAEDTHVGVVARLHNTSKVRVIVETVHWDLSIVAPYAERYVEELVQEFSDESQGDSGVREFPWDLLESDRISNYRMAVEPGETEQLTYDFIIPTNIWSVAVSIFVENIDEDAMGWSRREFYDIEESSSDQDI